jgi:hypothetical protein
LNRTAVIAAIALIATFLVGVVVGVVGDRFLHHPPGPPHPSPEAITRHLDRKLHFTDQQRAAVLQILQRRQERISEVWESVHPRVRQEVEATNAEIERLLTPEQRKEFGQIRMKMRMRFRR